MSSLDLEKTFKTENSLSTKTWNDLPIKYQIWPRLKSGVWRTWPQETTAQGTWLRLKDYCRSHLWRSAEWSVNLCLLSLWWLTVWRFVSRCHYWPSSLTRCRSQQLLSKLIVLCRRKISAPRDTMSKPTVKTYQQHCVWSKLWPKTVGTNCYYENGRNRAQWFNELNHSFANQLNLK